MLFALNFLLLASQKETEIVLHNGELLGGWKGGRRQKLPSTLCYSKRQRLFCKHWGLERGKKAIKVVACRDFWQQSHLAHIGACIHLDSDSCFSVRMMGMRMDGMGMQTLAFILDKDFSRNS